MNSISRCRAMRRLLLVGACQTSFVAALVSGCTEPTDFQKWEACVAEQKKKFGDRYSEGDSVPCTEKYLFNVKETNPYLNGAK